MQRIVEEKQHPQRRFAAFSRRLLNVIRSYASQGDEGRRQRHSRSISVAPVRSLLLGAGGLWDCFDLLGFGFGGVFGGV